MLQHFHTENCLKLEQFSLFRLAILVCSTRIKGANQGGLNRTKLWRSSLKEMVSMMAKMHCFTSKFISLQVIVRGWFKKLQGGQYSNQYANDCSFTLRKLRKILDWVLFQNNSSFKVILHCCCYLHRSAHIYCTCQEFLRTFETLHIMIRIIAPYICMKTHERELC